MAEHADASHADTATGEGHRHEQPEDWGWHGSWGRTARIAGWACIVILLTFNLTWHYNRSADPWIWGMAALLLFILLRDRYRRKNAWRED
jgi:Protein of unknown function (DUF2631)